MDPKLDPRIWIWIRNWIRGYGYGSDTGSMMNVDPILDLRIWIRIRYWIRGYGYGSETLVFIPLGKLLCLPLESTCFIFILYAEHLRLRGFFLKCILVFEINKLNLRGKWWRIISYIIHLQVYISRITHPPLEWKKIIFEKWSHMNSQ